MTWEIAVVLILLILLGIGLVMELARPDFLVASALMILILTRIITIEEALHGFANPGMLTIALLFIVAAAIQKTALFDRAASGILGSGRKGILPRLLLPVTGLSAFLNNTPIVVAFMPVVRKWCEEHRVSPSKLLIPLSYAAILGGTMTLMGTSTNLVVHGLLLDRGHEGFGFFQLGIVGLPVAVIGMLYLGVVGWRLLPDHKGLTDTVQENQREYMAEMRVGADYPDRGKTVQQAGLRRLRGVFLLGIIRGEEHISPVRSDTRVQVGDRLIFAGLIPTLAELQQRKGLKLETGTDLDLDTLKNGETRLVEVVVSHQSSLLYKKIRDSRFRSRFDAGVVAVHRHKERVKSKIGDIELKPGDTLLLVCGPDFENRSRQTNDFYVVTPMDTPPPLQDKRKGWIAISALLLLIALVTFSVLTMFEAMGVMVILLFVLKIITRDEAKRSVQTNVLLLIASSFGIGTALLKTGAAAWIADGLLEMGRQGGTIAVLFIIYILTNLFTEMITNSAAAVMMFPIGYAMAEQMQMDPTAIAILITIAASASFMTPIGYQTNLIVYGPGGYRFTDYIRVGFPLSLIVMLVTVWTVQVVWL